MAKHRLSWKTLFYGGILPALRNLGPSRCDAVLSATGHAIAAAWPGRRRELEDAIVRVKKTLDADWDVHATRRELEANLVRYAARDYPFGEDDDASALARFEVKGAEHLEAARARGRGVILVGSHHGSHLAALHWLYRNDIPLRLLVQRPQHVTGRLQTWFDADVPHPQSNFFLRRSMPAAEAADRMIRARAALRDGMAVYLGGDILWPGPNVRKGRLMGVERTFLAVWADLAVISRAPVVFVFASHRPGGQFTLSFDAPRTLEDGDQTDAVGEFLARLEDEIRTNPADAIAYLLWPCFGPPAESLEAANPRIGRRVAVAVGS